MAALQTTSKPSGLKLFTNFLQFCVPVGQSAGFAWVHSCTSLQLEGFSGWKVQGDNTHMSGSWCWLTLRLCSMWSLWHGGLKTAFQESESGSSKTSYSLANHIMSVTLHSLSQSKSQKASPQWRDRKIRFHLFCADQQHHNAEGCAYLNGKDS